MWKLGPLGALLREHFLQQVEQSALGLQSRTSVGFGRNQTGEGWEAEGLLGGEKGKRGMWAENGRRHPGQVLSTRPQCHLATVGGGAFPHKGVG